MNGSVAELTILYDETCALCLRSRGWLESQPMLVRVDLMASGSPEARRRYGRLPLGQELVVVADDGRAWVGPAAFLTCLWATRRYRSWSYRLSNKTMAPLAERFFDAVSKRRKALGRRVDADRCGACQAGLVDEPIALAPKKAVGEAPASGLAPRPADRLAYGDGVDVVGWSLPDVAAAGVHNDTVAGEQVVAVVNPRDHRRWAVFSRRVGDTVLTFRRRGDEIIDVDTGTVWHPNEGLALSGPLAGERLRPCDAEAMTDARFGLRFAAGRRWPS